MKFEITITQSGKEMKKKREYRRMSDTGGEDGKGKFGYIDEEEEVITNSVIYRQCVDAVDFPAVIKAINKME